MKVQKITTQPEFQPVTLQITIESQEEYDLLKNMFWHTDSIPEAMLKLRSIEDTGVGKLQVIMIDILESL